MEPKSSIQLHGADLINNATILYTKVCPQTNCLIVFFHTLYISSTPPFSILSQDINRFSILSQDINRFCILSQDINRFSSLSLVVNRFSSLPLVVNIFSSLSLVVNIFSSLSLVVNRLTSRTDNTHIPHHQF